MQQLVKNTLIYLTWVCKCINLAHYKLKLTTMLKILLSDKAELNSYLACAVAENFCVGEQYQNEKDILKAYSFHLIKKR